MSNPALQSARTWWDKTLPWVLLPVWLPFLLLVMLAMFLFFTPFLPSVLIGSIRQRREEKQIAASLAKVGRVLSWSEFESQLDHGTGTVIFDTWYCFKSLRVWRSNDDLLELFPGLPTRYHDPFDSDAQKQICEQHGNECDVRYLDVESGSAKLVDLHLSIKAADQLLSKFPNARFVTLVRPIDEAGLFAGDFRSVFQPRSAKESLQISIEEHS